MRDITFIQTGPSSLEDFLGTAPLPASSAACLVMWKVAVQYTALDGFEREGVPFFTTNLALRKKMK